MDKNSDLVLNNLINNDSDEFREKKQKAFHKLNAALNNLSLSNEKLRDKEITKTSILDASKIKEDDLCIGDYDTSSKGNSDSIENSFYYPDEDYDDIDDAYDSSEDSDDEYRGYCFCADSDEENDLEMQKDYDQKATSEVKNAILLFKGSDLPPVGLVKNKYFTPSSPFTPSLFPNVPPYWTFSSHVDKGPEVLPELYKIMKWRHSPFIPKIIKKVVENSGYRSVKRGTQNWVVAWEKNVKSECFKSFQSYQKFNHIPCTFTLGRKDCLWRNIRSKINKHGRKEFGFMQKSYILPNDLDLLKKEWAKFAKKGSKWIIKPPASSRGNGIRVISDWKEFPKREPLIVQKYIERPLLINGSKFDLRLYVIITSVNPLRIYLHNDGLARFASQAYDPDSLNNQFIHLTNYSINKFANNFAINADIDGCYGHKWSLKALMGFFQECGINTKRLWGTIRNLIIKTIISAEASLNRICKNNIVNRSNCFELFGFDVILDENMVPWLLEINISPSFHTDLPLDLHIKGPLTQTLLNTGLFQIPPKLRKEQQEAVKSHYNLTEPICFDRRIFTTQLTQDETNKHNLFTSSEVELRDEYLDSILENLTPDDVRCLIIAEDELARSSPLERIFPTTKTYQYHKFFESPRYYNRLLDAWVTKYSKNRTEGIKLLQQLCEKSYHLETAPLGVEPSDILDIFDLNCIFKNLSKGIDIDGNPLPQF